MKLIDQKQPVNSQKNLQQDQNSKNWRKFQSRAS